MQEGWSLLDIIGLSSWEGGEPQEMSLGGQISWRKKPGSWKDEEQVEPPSPTKEPEGGLACWRLRGTRRGSQHRTALTMPLCLALLLLTGLSACTVAGDKKLAPGGTEAGSLVTVTLEVTLGKGRG